MKQYGNRAGMFEQPSVITSILMFAFGIGLFVPSSAFGASFDCRKASSFSEKLICSMPSLSQADDQLYIYYMQAKLATGNSSEFKSFTRQNFHLREECTTIACIEDWYKTSSDRFKKLSAPDVVQPCQEGQQLTVEGTLARKTFPGPPNYESVALGDEPETSFVLELDSELDCPKQYPGQGDFKSLQLILEPYAFDRHARLVGSRVKVVGTTLFAETEHHHTPILLQMQRIDALSEPPSVSPPVPPAAPPAKEKPQPLTTSTFEFEILRTRSLKSVGNSFFASKASAGGVYIAVEWTYKNISRRPVTMFSHPTIHLESPDGILYNEDIGASAMYATEFDTDQKVFSDLNPGIKVRSAAVFEVSEELFDPKTWTIKIDADRTLKVGF